MSSTRPIPQAQLIPLDLITVINPRARNKKIFNEIVENIAKIGLKKPITVASRQTPDGTRYDLVCGQGRLEAFQALGQQEIPAIVIGAEMEDCLVMSLVENLARRQHRPIDLFHDIKGMKTRGYSDAEIGRKTGLSTEYVKSLLRLLEGNEIRLLNAVETGQVPVSIAAEIASVDDAGVQRVLQQAYEQKLLRGHKLTAVRRLVEQRRLRGKGRLATERNRDRPLTVDGLLRTYRDDTEKKKRMVRKAETTRDCLVFVTEGMKKLLNDENFTTLLRAEGLDNFPKPLGERLFGRTAS